ncbi:MAG: restriction endonuclease subunit S [Acidovorax sp.]|nr:MAG: restriction endonuclease subunit S [Acidovorax sp.]
MSSEWTVTTIGEICNKVFSGGTPTSTNAAYYEGGTVPWLRTKEVNYCKIYDTEQRITQLGFENSSTKLVPANSVIVAMYGNGDTAGRVAINKVPITTNQACCNLVVDASKADYRFVYYYLMGQYRALVDLKNGGAQQNLNGQLIKAFPITLPSVEEQRELSGLLEALDDRITLLRETNATLEAIAQALFKSWFVDFDPVRAKMEGRAPEGMDEATAALFPDALEESELGWVPKGWRVGVFGDFAQLKKGSVNPGGQPQTTFEHFSLPSYDAGQRPIFELGESIKSNKTPVTPDAVLLSKLNPHIPRVWLPVECRSNAVCSTEFLVFVPVGIGSRELIYCAFNSPDFIARLQQLVTGTSNSHQRIKPDQVALMSSVVPTSDVARKFEAAAKPIFQKVFANREQAKTLSTLRDTLLPRLISGQLRLPEAQALADGV